MKKISVFNQCVTVPDFAEPIHKLPDELQYFFFNVFESGFRAMPSRDMLEQLSSVSHSKFRPTQQTAWSRFPLSAGVPKDGDRVFLRPAEVPPGQLLAISTHNGTICALVNDAGNLVRENGMSVLEGVANGSFKYFRVGPHTTLLGSAKGLQNRPQFGGPYFLIDEDTEPRKIPEVDLSPTGSPNVGLVGDAPMWISQGKLHRGDSESSIAEFQDRTALFCGSKFALVLTLTERELADVFLIVESKVRRIVSLPPVMGKVSNLRCTFSGESVWLFLTAHWEGEDARYVQVIHRDGNLLGIGAGPECRGEWFSRESVRTAYELIKPRHTLHRLAGLPNDKLITVECGENLQLEVVEAELWKSVGTVGAILRFENEFVVGVRNTTKEHRVSV